MFKKLALISAAAAFAVPMAAFAAQPVALDGYYVADSTFDVEDNFDENGDGFGVRVLVPFEGSGIRLHAEYQTVEIEDTDIDQLRLGGGFMTEGNARFGIVGEYISVDSELFDSEPDGFGAHARAEVDLSEQFQLYGQIGYVSISDSGDDTDGVEYLAGAVFNITPMFGILVDYRYSDLELDGDLFDKLDYSLEDLRVGVRVNFGA